jgi:hypothetical protein
MDNPTNNKEFLTVFLDNHLLLRCFTINASHLFTLTLGDIGRPKPDIVGDLDYTRL